MSSCLTAENHIESYENRKAMDTTAESTIISVEKIWFNQKEASDYIGMGGPDFWIAARNEGLPFYRLGNRIIYNKADLDRFVKSKKSVKTVPQSE